MPGRRVGLVGVGVAVADVGEAMARGEALEQIEGADALARGHRVGEFFIEDGDVHGIPFPPGLGAHGIFEILQLCWQLASSSRGTPMLSAKQGGTVTAAPGPVVGPTSPETTRFYARSFSRRQNTKLADRCPV